MVACYPLFLLTILYPTLQCQVHSCTSCLTQTLAKRYKQQQLSVSSFLTCLSLVTCWPRLPSQPASFLAICLCRSVNFQASLLGAFVGVNSMQEMLLNGRMRTSSITPTLACVICEPALGVCPCHIHSSTEVVSVSPNIRQPCVMKYHQKWR